MKLKFSDQPVAYQELAKSVIYLLVGFTIVHWSDAQIVLVLAVVSGVLGIIVWSNVTPNTHVQTKIDDALAMQKADITTFLAAPPDPEPQAAAKVADADIDEVAAPRKTAAKKAAAKKARKRST